ncbi:MAG: spermidine/putrescine ABC transporter substrate-binding protein [Clostridia bacterium]|nr:spermidine/putrescine ABC transporter substrate-binding protein [Clostridia bacterium]
MKKVIAIALAGAVGLAGLALTNFIGDNRPVLKVANWAEYIDGGDEDSPLIAEFEEWYEAQTGKKIRVEYCIADDNETLYNMIKMGDHFDLICPSEYMLMKLIAEDRLQPLPDTFYDASNPLNYYINNVSPWILNTFRSNEILGSPWSEYAAGYMWGTTGFVYNPGTEEKPLVKAEDVATWSVFTNADYYKKITAKNNIRDTYFTGLAMHYDSELRTEQEKYENSAKTANDLKAYQTALSTLMNDTKAATMDSVKEKLMAMTDNLYGFETDEGKSNVISGKITVNYQWSGDAVYIMDEAQYDEDGNELENPVYLHYSIPETVSNLWFDGWAITKDCKDENIQAATMFINFLSRPDNVVRNMNYIGYTSCVGSDTVFEEFVLANYSAEEDDETAKEYDLNYYFNSAYNQGDDTTKDPKYIFYAPEDQFTRQLFAQYPDENTLARCVAMQYFDYDANSRANSMWSDITFF